MVVSATLCRCDKTPEIPLLRIEMTRIQCLAILSILLAPTSSAFADGEVEDLNTQMMRATVKISHPSSTASGFILSADENKEFILVTAAHVFEKTPDDETTIVFRIRQAEGEYKKEPVKLAIRKEGKPVWTKHPSEDVAVIGISPPENADVPRVSTSLLATDESLQMRRVHPGDNLALIGFPHREEGSEAGFALLRNGPIASFPLLPTAKTRTFYLSTNVFEGDSGGPVYLDRASNGGPGAGEEPLIVGLAAGQRNFNEEAKGVYATMQFRYRLGLAIVVHASLIKETIDLLP